jgi:hypothetical protein
MTQFAAKQIVPSVTNGKRGLMMTVLSLLVLAGEQFLRSLTIA